MLRSISSRARVLRLLAALTTVPTLWACTSYKLAPPGGSPVSVQNRRFPVGLNRQLDLLFMVDDSKSMSGLQRKMAERLPDFMNVLQALPGGLPDLHVAVVSSSLGTGAFRDVIGNCQSSSPGDDDGRFQHAASCTALKAGETFIKAEPGNHNYTGEIADVFACIAKLGDGGCGIEQQFQSTRRALDKARDPNDPDNAGFLRDDAILGIIMLTNEDDCSVPYDSTLFDPSQRTVATELGGLQNYRCNEFGHLCDGRALPHQISQEMTLANCTPAEEKGRLLPVADFVKFVQGLKEDPGRLFVAALAGPAGPYTLFPAPADVGNNATEIQPSIRHSCAAPDQPLADYADPAIRVAAWVNAFPPTQRKLASICEQDFKPAMEGIAHALGALVQPQCLEHPVALTKSGRPNCQVAMSSGSGQPFAEEVPECTAGGTAFPCWRIDAAASCAGGAQLNVCWEAACDPTKAPATRQNAEASCAIAAGP
jgi:hypothetical protein